jgi:hypothetical protein
VTPFSRTLADLDDMPLSDPAVRRNLTTRCYPSGHMIYLDGDSRTALKGDLAGFYDSTVGDQAAVGRIGAGQRRASPGGAASSGHPSAGPAST